MTTRDQPPRRESAFALVRRLVTGGVGLVRLEIQHGRQEVAERIRGNLRAAVMFGIAAALALLTLIAFVNLVIALIALLVPTPIAALIVLLLFGVLAALFGFLGVRRVRSPVPEETIASVKEDIAWAKRLLRRE
jgi:uncharacterized membrane protein YqjE